MDRLSDLTSTIFSGVTFRTKVADDPEGDLLVIQMKDLVNGYNTISPQLTRIKSGGISSNQYLRKGDVLFIGKGANNYAIEYMLDYPRVVAASAFFVIRPNQQRLRPGYLAWFINQPPVQQYLKENMAGTYIPNINKNAVEGITLIVPPLRVQEHIAKVEDLRKKEISLLNEIKTKRDNLISHTLLQVVKNNI